MSFSLVIGQSKAHGQNFSNEPKDEELKKEPPIEVKIRLTSNSLPQSSASNTLKSRKVSKRPDMSIRFTKPFKAQLETTSDSKLRGIDEEIKRETVLEIKMANAYPILKIKPEIVGVRDFDQTFKLERRKISVNDDQVFFDKGDFAILSEKIESSLAVGVICFDLEGKVIAKGLGNFNEEDVKSFCHPSNGKDQIRFLLDSAKATSGTNMAVILTGMHTSEYYREINAEIKKCYGNIPVSHLVNPWKIPAAANETEKEQFKQFLRFGFSLKMGITANGSILSADGCNKDVEFLRFSELGFAEWKVRVNFKSQEDFNQYEARLISIAQKIYDQRKLYSIPYKEVEGIEKIEGFCKENGLLLQELLINPKSCQSLFKSDNLRRVLYYYLNEKLTPALNGDNPRQFAFFEEIKTKILNFSVSKTIKELNVNLPNENKLILKVVKTIFPGLLPDFLNMEEVKPWLMSKNGEKVKEAIAGLYGNTI